ncbi:MAG: anthranilate synthase component I [Acidimicrobiia bacterium]|nr:MAG: anthranilate synthase component I [Acidimicrobiia bacterium]
MEKPPTLGLTMDLETFVDLAGTYSVIPLPVVVLGDTHTAVSVFDSLVGDSEGFLLESVEGGERWGRWSFIGWDSALTISAIDGEVTCTDDAVVVPAGDPLEALEALLDRYDVAPWDQVAKSVAQPPLHSGAVGYLAYDVVRYVESLPNGSPDDRALPEMAWQFVGGLAALDRLSNTITVIRNVYVTDDPARDYAEAVLFLERAVSSLSRATLRTPGNMPELGLVPTTVQSMDRTEYESVVEKAKSLIREGEVFQIVPSIRFEAVFGGDAFAVYRALRLINPSPFMFFVRTAGIAIAGSSPELMSRVRDGVAYSRPIAGTRPRGRTDAEDQRLESELLADPKEQAEHVMLVDLARNDLGRVCEFGTVTVDDLMVVERYSHVMHIVSGVSGTLRTGIGPVEVLRATFPHGTVTGAPKVRAMELIDELEPLARGPYAGAVGYIDFSGNLDTAIALRTCICRGTTAWVQAGAGIVVDSDPSSEYDECINKATAVLNAVAAADSMSRVLGADS